MQYRIIECWGESFSLGSSKLQKEVNDAIQDGWAPIGGVSAAYSDNPVWGEMCSVLQAMSKD